MITFLKNGKEISKRGGWQNYPISQKIISNIKISIFMEFYTLKSLIFTFLSPNDKRVKKNSPTPNN